MKNLAESIVIGFFRYGLKLSFLIWILITGLVLYHNSYINTSIKFGPAIGIFLIYVFVLLPNLSVATYSFLFSFLGPIYKILNIMPIDTLSLKLELKHVGLSKKILDFYGITGGQLYLFFCGISFLFNLLCILAHTCQFFIRKVILSSIESYSIEILSIALVFSYIFAKKSTRLFYIFCYISIFHFVLSIISNCSHGFTEINQIIINLFMIVFILILMFLFSIIKSLNKNIPNRIIQLDNGNRNFSKWYYFRYENNLP